MASVASVPAFMTEGVYDKLTVGGVDYSGSTKPRNGTVLGNGLIQWTSDSSAVASGWKICGPGGAAEAVFT